MTALVGTDCKDPRSAPLMTDEWSRFLNPVLLLVLYYVLSFESQFLLSNKVSYPHIRSSYSFPSCNILSNTFSSFLSSSQSLLPSLNGNFIVEDLLFFFFVLSKLFKLYRKQEAINGGRKRGGEVPPTHPSLTRHVASWGSLLYLSSPVLLWCQGEPTRN